MEKERGNDEEEKEDDLQSSMSSRSISPAPSCKSHNIKTN